MTYVPRDRTGLGDLAQCAGKRRLASEAFAKSEASRLTALRGQALRAYSCGLCGRWHLTHTPLELPPETFPRPRTRAQVALRALIRAPAGLNYDEILSAIRASDGNPHRPATSAHAAAKELQALGYAEPGRRGTWRATDLGRRALQVWSAAPGRMA